MADESSDGTSLLSEESSANAVSVLLDNHRAFLRYVERKLHNPILARDLLQEAFSKAIEQPESLPGVEGVTFWFYRCVRNALVATVLREPRGNHVLEIFAREIENRNSPGARELKHEIHASVDRIARVLKPECAAIARAVELQQESVRAFGERAGLTPGSAAVQVYRVRQELKKHVVASFRTCAQFGYLTCNCQRGVA